MNMRLFENKNCMEGMKEYPDKYFDLAIVDPPYGIGEDGRNNHTRGKLAKAKDYRSTSRYDNSIPDYTYFQELFRVSKNQIIWGGNYYIEFLKNTPCVIVWDKDNGESDFADCELAWTSFETAVRRFKFRWSGMLQEDMKNKEERIHPNHKPTALYKWLVKNYAKQGYKILDTHVGSASSLITFEDAGLDYVGFELDEIHYSNAVKRIEQYRKQLKLF
jgi:site-specific DNA-methyltransferase (adenine-specific)